MKKLPDDEKFKYVDYQHTNLRVTFARIRKQQAEEAAKRPSKVTPIKRKGTA